jgi:hypothetical protein
MIDEAIVELEPLIGVRAACRAACRAQATTAGTGKTRDPCRLDRWL